MTNADVAQVIDQLFTAARVERVVSVDDMYSNKAPVEDALGLVEGLNAVTLQEVFSAYPEITAFEEPDIRKDQIGTLWAKLNLGVRQGLLKLLRNRADVSAAPLNDDTANKADHGASPELTVPVPAVAAPVMPVAQPTPENQAIDEKTVVVLPILLEKYNPFYLSLKEWHERKDEFVAAGIPKTLILVDENFEREGGLKDDGIRLIRELLKDERSEILCALLSHGYSPEKIHEQWNDLCEREKLPKSRFVLIPKSLVADDPLGFARLVKLAVLNGEADKFKTHVSEIIKAAHDLAAKRMASIDIYDFDQIVFRSSEREGVWEPDTLLRVFALFHRDEVRKLTKGDTLVHGQAASIRTVSQIPTHSSSAPNHKTWKVQRIEFYEDDAYLNPQFLPIELGDIFQKDGAAERKYMLLAQPCDLMVRPEGSRNSFVQEGLLAEIIDSPPNDPSSHVTLEYFDPENTKEYFVSFRSSYVVRLDVLDFCAFNDDGQSKLKYDGECPATVIPAWKHRHALLTKSVEKLVRRYEELTKGKLSAEEANAMLTRCSNEKLFSGKIDVARRTVTYNLKRIGRLRSPRAIFVLACYANFIARQAFEHDFGPDEAKPFPAAETPEENVSGTASSSRG